MKGVADLSTFILASLKDEDAGRVALYHYLRNFHEDETAITPTLINSFYGEALQLNHWQLKKTALHEDVQELLQRFFSVSNEPFRLDEVWDLKRLQLVLLEQAESLSQMAQEHENSLIQPGEKIRIIMESATRTLSLKRLSNGAIIVKTYSGLARVLGNKLIPLGTEQEVHYDASLELLKGHIQKLKPSPHSQVRFLVSKGEVEAQFISGFAFRQTQSFRVPGLSHEPRLFYPLKRLERFFVNRSSDPYYMEILGGLDRAIRMVMSRAESSQTFALQAFDSGQIAFDQIFPDDKALYTRLKELAKLLSASRRPQRPQIDSPKDISF